MTWALGTRRGSADSTPSTSVQMMISAAPSSAPNIDPEKSLPLRPSVVCMPPVVVAMNPVTISRPVKPEGTSRLKFCSLTDHCTAGPRGPHSTMTTSRASTQRTVPGMRPRSRRKWVNRRVDQISP